MRIESHAKINWLLRVLRRRNDGYHEIETIFQEISLADVLEIEESSELGISCDHPGVPLDETNLVSKAWRIAHEEWGSPPVSVAIEKNIPMMGGLGGGSSNAAALLRGVNAMFDLGKDDVELEKAASRVGSDTAFFIRGGTQYATGRGELLTPISSSISGAFLLATPEVGVSTAEAYQALGMRNADNREPIGVEGARELMSRETPSRTRLINEFETVVLERHALIDSVHSRLEETGSEWVRLSGSGSTVVAWYSSEQMRDSAMEALGSTCPAVPAVPVNRS